MSKRNDRVIRRKDDWQSWQAQEKRLVSRFPDKIQRWETKYGPGDHRSQVLRESISLNLAYHHNLIHKNKIKTFLCGKCNVVKPYYKFYFSDSSARIGRYVNRCRKCTAKVNKNRYDPNKTKQNRVKNHRARLRIMVSVSIKRHIAKVTGNYCELSVPKIWETLKKTCNYDIEDLIEHLERQFGPRMNWQNQKTPRKPGVFGWHMDHIVPHADFHYDSLDHPDFGKCWALKNLRPLEAMMNMQKGNRKLYHIYQASFRHGLKRALKGEIYRKGVWKHLNYSNLEAKKILAKKIASIPGANWANWGAFWQIDHIQPVASLAFVSANDENFKICWGLGNLRPLLRKINASKGSRWENRLWFHNYN
jgi:hypothetical protein